MRVTHSYEARGKGKTVGTFSSWGPGRMIDVDSIVCIVCTYVYRYFFFFGNGIPYHIISHH